DLADGRWDKSRPGLIISFDDGHRSHREIAAPVLERYGFVGWFFIPVGFVDCPAEGQSAFARDHGIKSDWRGGRPSARLALSWDEVRGLTRRHVVGCHTLTHRRLTADLTEAELDRETAGAKGRMEEVLGREVPTFAW